MDKRIERYRRLLRKRCNKKYIGLQLQSCGSRKYKYWLCLQFWKPVQNKIMKLLLSAGLAASVLLISFNAKNKSIKSISGSREQAVDVRPGSSPYLSKDHRGRTVLSWVRQTGDSSAVLCYSILDGTDRTVTIPPSNNISAHAENLPKVIFKYSGDIIAI